MEVCRQNCHSPPIANYGADEAVVRVGLPPPPPLRLNVLLPGWCVLPSRKLPPPPSKLATLPGFCCRPLAVAVTKLFFQAPLLPLLLAALKPRALQLERLLASEA